MKRGKMTYAPLYFEDFRVGCEDLTNEEIGAYLRVLFEIYDAMGPIEYDDRKLAKRLNVRPHKAHAMVETLIQLRKLYLTPTGQISNHRAEDEIMRYVSISVQNQLNAKSVGKGRISPAKKPNGFNQIDERPLSERLAILDKKNNNTSSFDVDALHPPAEPTTTSRAQEAIEAARIRKRQRSGKNFH